MKALEANTNFAMDTNFPKSQKKPETKSSPAKSVSKPSSPVKLKPPSPYCITKKIKKEPSGLVSKKRYHKWNDFFLVQYKWLQKREIDGKFVLFCKCCSKFPQFTSGNVNLVKGFSGNNQGYKEETFARHENYHSSGQHKKCKDAWDKMNLGPIASSLAPDPKTWQKKISRSLNAQLCAKFVASNLICTEAMSGKKFEPVLDSFKLVGGDVGTTHRNRQASTCSVQKCAK